MSLFIMLEHPEMTATECINESKRIMKGNKGKLFLLQLSFIGWWLLCVITMGIAILYVVPYFSTTYDLSHTICMTQATYQLIEIFVQFTNSKLFRVVYVVGSFLYKLRILKKKTKQLKVYNLSSWEKTK
jgi:uncharacterized membrane protein